MDDALLGESDLGSGDPGDLEAVVSVSLRFGLWLYVPLQAGATTELENEEFMNRRYDFRYNLMSGGPEYREKNTFCF